METPSTESRLATPIIAGTFAVLLLACCGFFLINDARHDIEHRLVIQPLQPGRLVIEVRFRTGALKWVKHRSDIVDAINRGAFEVFGAKTDYRRACLGAVHEINKVGKDVSAYKLALLLDADRQSDELLRAWATRLQRLPDGYRVKLYTEYRTLDSSRRLVRARRTF